MDREGKQALRRARLSCRAFRANAVRLQLFAAILRRIERLRGPPVPAT